MKLETREAENIFFSNLARLVERTAHQRTALTAQDGGSCLLHGMEATCD